MILGQRDPDDITLLATLRAKLDELAGIVVSRWGRVPIVTADPTSPPDGSVWIRSDTGQQVMRISGISQGVPQTAGFRNAVVNGGMNIAQRGTSVAGLTATGYSTVDRWRMYVNAPGTAVRTDAQVADAPTDSPFTNSYKMTVTTASGAPAAGMEVNFGTILEGFDNQHWMKGKTTAQPLTMTFWIKGSLTGTYNVELYDSTNTRYCPIQYTILAASAWEFKTITFPADTTGTLPNTNAGAIAIQFFLGNGSQMTSGTYVGGWTNITANRAVGQTNVLGTINATWQITGVQLELGSVATPFERRPYGTELALCQRYFQRYQSTANRIPIALGVYWSTTDARYVLPLLVQMRASPTVTVNGAMAQYTMLVVGANIVPVTFTAVLAAPHVVELQTTSAAQPAAGIAVRLAFIDGSTGTIDVSAEL